MKIEYKQIRHGYARIDDEGNLKITIPSYLRNNEKFKASLIAKGQTLLKKYQKKEHILTSDKDSVLLFGERIPLTDLYEQYNKIFPKPVTRNSKLVTSKFLKEILAEYSSPILQKYSEKL
jgi:predicted metal-dependent hydrolase